MEAKNMPKETFTAAVVFPKRPRDKVFAAIFQPTPSDIFYPDFTAGNKPAVLYLERARAGRYFIHAEVFFPSPQNTLSILHAEYAV